MCFLLILLACQPDAPLVALEACEDQACRSAAMLPAWQHDPAGTRAWLLALEDPTVQATLIEGLALELPDDAAALCRELPAEGHARTRCERRVVRPHLEGRGKPLAKEAGAASAAGPRSATLPLLELEAAPWSNASPGDLAEALATCEAGEPVLCGRLVSRERATAGQWEPAGLACQAGDPSQGQDYAECLFQAAEVLAETGGAGTLPHALRLCSWSRFGPMCVAHSLTLVGPAVPAADSIAQADIDAAQDVARAIRDASEGQPRLGATWEDRYWSSWTASTYKHASALDGRLLALLPDAAQGHGRVAMAARLLAGRDLTGVTLDDLIHDFEAAAAEPGVEPDPRGQAQRFDLVTWHHQQTWAFDRNEERDIPASWVMGPARRAVADEPDAELRIAVLEAAAQLREPPPASFFLAVVGDESEHRLVRWTGARIGGYLDPEAAAALSDPDSLVQQALDRPRKKPAGNKGKKPPLSPTPAG
jgi:hypothetical protein